MLERRDVLVQINTFYNFFLLIIIEHYCDVNGFSQLVNYLGDSCSPAMCDTDLLISVLSLT